MTRISIKAAVLTVSDSRTTADDVSGDTLQELVKEGGVEVVERLVIADDPEKLRDALTELSERDDVNLVLTTGGTGFGPRDNTPEVTRAVIEREAPGIAEAMRRETADKTRMAMLSRGVAGIRGKTLIINLPGSPRAVEECFAVIRPVLEHAIALINGETEHEG